MKKIQFLSVLIAFTMIFGLIAPNVSVAASANLSFDSTQETNDMYTQSGEYLGTATISRSFDREELKEGVEVTITTTTEYSLASPFDTNTAYLETFKNTVEQNTIFVNYDYEIYVNDELIENPESTFVAETLTPESTFSTLAKDTGGVPHIQHYYSTSDMNSYTFASYESMAWKTFGDSSEADPSGAHVQKTGVKPTNTWFASAQTGVDLFQFKYENFQRSYWGVYTALAGTIVNMTWAFLAALVLGGGATALIALQCIEDWNSAKEQVNKTYTYITKL